MPTRYFAASVDQNWDTLGNWWSDAACTEGFSGTLTGVTVTDTDETVTCDSTAGLVVGRPITGTGIDTSSTVASITNGTEFELSLPAIANGSSNLSCELHVIPVTGDDVVIATGNGTVAGTPSADVLGLVTVNGDSVLNVTLEAASFEFNDTSSNAGTITGNVTFNNDSHSDYNGYIAGNCTFNDDSIGDGTITGNADYYDNSATYSGITATGDVTFNNTSHNDTYVAAATVTFNDYSYNSYTLLATTVTFNDYTYNRAGSGSPITATTIEFYDNSFNGFNNVASGYISGDCWFYGSSFNEYNGYITGNATFPESEYSTALQGPQGWSPGNGPQLGTVSGTVTFSSLTPVKFTLETGESWQLDTSGWVFDTAGQNWEFNGESYNNTYGIINGDCVFNGGPSYPIPYQNQGTVNGNCVFNVYYGLDTGAVVNGDCVFNDTAVKGTITGNCTFNGYSWCNWDIVIIGNCTLNETAYLDGTITGNCEFNSSSYNYADITGNATFTAAAYSNPQQGTVSGTVTFSSITPVKFTLANSESWTSNTSGWVFDTAGQNWEFNDTSFNDTTGSIYGDCIFDDTSYNYGDVYGNCVFTGNSRNGDSYNATVGTVTGDFQWGSTDYNYGTITGDCVGGAVANEYPGVIHGNCTVGTGGTVAINGSIINGDCDFLSGCYQYSSSAEINGNVTFSGNRVNGNGGMNAGVINGDVTFSDNTIHDGNSTINGAVTFNDTSRSQSTINGPVTFNDSSVHDTSNYTITGDCTFNDDAYTYNYTAGITGNCTFNDNSYIYSTVITGNCTFNDRSYVQTGTVTGNATFTNTAFPGALAYIFNPQQGTVSGTVDFPNGATFTLASNQSWTVDTSAWTGTLAWKFYDDSSNGGTLTGNATVRQHAAAFIAWRDYATSTYITGTLTLQFPEMDILGTGLL